MFAHRSALLVTALVLVAPLAPPGAASAPTFVPACGRADALAAHVRAVGGCGGARERALSRLAPAGTGDSPADGPTCGYPGEPSRCPTAVDARDPGPLYFSSLATSQDGTRVYEVGGADRVQYVLTRDMRTAKRLRLLAFRTTHAVLPVHSVLSSDGRVLVAAGFTFGSGSAVYAVDLVRQVILWVRIETNKGLDEGVSGLALEPGGRHVLLAEYLSESMRDYAPYDWRVRALDLMTGRELWRNTSAVRSGRDQLPLAATAGRGWFAVGGMEHVNAERTDYDAVVRTYDSRTGRLLAMARYDSPDHADDLWVAAAGSTRDSSLFVGSSDRGALEAAPLVGSFTATGRGRWVKEQKVAMPTYAFDADLGGGRVVAVGASTPTPAPYAANVEAMWASYAAAWDAVTGASRWLHTETPYDDRALMHVTVHGSKVYATGWTEAAWTGVFSGTPYVALLAPQGVLVEARDLGTGTAAWTSRYTHEVTAFTVPRGIAASVQGVAVTAYLLRQDNTEYVARGYVFLGRPDPLLLRYDP